MILVTVGMQLGFDRLVRAMDAIAPELATRIVAQTGKGSYRPANMEMRPRLDPESFEALVDEAQLIVSHAGIGSVLTAARAQTPIVLFPRRARYNEHRNDHQLATVRALEGRPGILVAWNEADLAARIEEGLSYSGRSSAAAPNVQRLHEALSSFIETGTL